MIPTTVGPTFLAAFTIGVLRAELIFFSTSCIFCSCVTAGLDVEFSFSGAFPAKPQPAAKMLMLTLMAARASKVFFIRVFSVICFFIDGFPLYCYCRAAALEGAAADSCFIANRRPAMASSRLSLAIFVRRAFTRSFVSLRAPSSFVL